MLIGYARVSTKDQHLELQTDALTKAGVEPDRIYKEFVSGVKTKRPQLEECLRSLREGDILVIWKLDRLGRSVMELAKLSKVLEDRGVELRSLNECIDTTTPTGKFTFHILAAVAQLERDMIIERTRAGLEAAFKHRGRRGGRKPILTKAQVEKAAELNDAKILTMPQIAAFLNVSRSTIYRALDKREKEQQLKEAA